MDKLPRKTVEGMVKVIVTPNLVLSVIKETKAGNSQTSNIFTKMGYEQYYGEFISPVRYMRKTHRRRVPLLRKMSDLLLFLLFTPTANYSKDNREKMLKLMKRKRHSLLRQFQRKKRLSLAGENEKENLRNLSSLKKS